MQTITIRHVISTARFDFAGSTTARKLMRTVAVWYNPDHTTGLPPRMVEAYQLLILIEHESQGGENHFGYGLGRSLHAGGHGSHLFHVYALGKASTVHGRIW